MVGTMVRAALQSLAKRSVMLPRILSPFATLACLFALTGCDHTASATNTGADGKPSIGTLEKVWGRRGISDGRFQKPRAMAIDKQDRLYIVDMTARIQVFDADGNFIRSWQTPIHENGRPTGLSIDRAGNLAVADTHYFEVLFYTPEGELLKDKTFGPDHGPGPGPIRPGDRRGGRFARETILCANMANWIAFKNSLTTANSFCNGASMAKSRDSFLGHKDWLIDDQDRVWVADSANNRIQVFDNRRQAAVHLGRKGDRAGATDRSVQSDSRRRRPRLRLELGNSRVQKFTLDGKSLGTWGTAGSDEGQLFSPWAIARDSQGRIYMLDTENHRVQRVRM